MRCVFVSGSWLPRRRPIALPLPTPSLSRAAPAHCASVMPAMALWQSAPPQVVQSAAQQTSPCAEDAVSPHWHSASPVTLVHGVGGGGLAGVGGGGELGGLGGGGYGAYTALMAGGVELAAALAPTTAAMIHATQITVQMPLPMQLARKAALVRGPRSSPLVAHMPKQQKMGEKQAPMKKRIQPQVGSSLLCDDRQGSPSS